MQWELLQAVSSVIATTAVTVSVVYLAIQVRRGAKATSSQTYQFATQALGEMAATIGVSKELSRIFATGMADPDALDQDEYLQFAYLTISLFRRYENVFFQYESGLIDDDFWIGHRDNLLWFYHRPGMQRWWQERRLSFSKRFREFLEKSSPEDVAAQPARKV
ncbi:MAG TPA: hypothetical protein VMW31_06530 [Devosiaceae bacterium]|nr:hypothetical protein [Devosiaceae bacterium]